MGLAFPILKHYRKPAPIPFKEEPRRHEETKESTKQKNALSHSCCASSLRTFVALRFHPGRMHRVWVKAANISACLARRSSVSESISRPSESNFWKMPEMKTRCGKT